MHPNPSSIQTFFHSSISLFSDVAFSFEHTFAVLYYSTKILRSTIIVGKTVGPRHFSHLLTKNVREMLVVRLLSVHSLEKT